jgi:hypothetical protein
MLHAGCPGFCEDQWGPGFELTSVQAGTDSTLLGFLVPADGSRRRRLVAGRTFPAVVGLEVRAGGSQTVNIGDRMQLVNPRSFLHPGRHYGVALNCEYAVKLANALAEAACDMAHLQQTGGEHKE